MSVLQAEFKRTDRHEYDGRSHFDILLHAEVAETYPSSKLVEGHCPSCSFFGDALVTGDKDVVHVCPECDTPFRARA